MRAASRSSRASSGNDAALPPHSSTARPAAPPSKEEMGALLAWRQDAQRCVIALSVSCHGCTLCGRCVTALRVSRRRVPGAVASLSRLGRVNLHLRGLPHARAWRGDVASCETCRQRCVLVPHPSLAVAPARRRGECLRRAPVAPSAARPRPLPPATHGAHRPPPRPLQRRRRCASCWLPLEAPPAGHARRPVSRAALARRRRGWIWRRRRPGGSSGQSREEVRCCRHAATTARAHPCGRRRCAGHASLCATRVRVDVSR